MTVATTELPTRLHSAPVVADSAAPSSTGLNGIAESLADLLSWQPPFDPTSQESSSDSLAGIINKEVLRRLLTALRHRDMATLRHSRRVALLAAGLGERLGWEPRHLRMLEVASLLHDVGKIGVPDHILHKSGALTPEERDLMSLQRSVGLSVLQACRVYPEVLQIIAQASGPGMAPIMTGQSQQQLGARILTIADAYESLSSSRAYRDSQPHSQIMEELQRGVGSQFDGNLVHVLGRWIEEEGHPFTAVGASIDDMLKEHPTATSEDLADIDRLTRIFSNLYLLESLYDGYYLLNRRHEIVVWSVGLEDLTNISAADRLGEVWHSDLVGYCGQDNGSLSAQQLPLTQVLRENKPLTSMCRVQTGSGRTVTVEVQTLPLITSQKPLCGVAEVFRGTERSDLRRSTEFQRLRLAASRDALTCVANRGELETQLAELMNAYHKEQKHFSLVFLDADHFKLVNDRYGHAVGDQVLIDLARLLQRELYSGELVGRYGGEEFVILCPETRLEDAVKRSERLRLILRQQPIGGVEGLKVTASFGIAEAETNDTVETLLRRADKALYEAKQLGRDRVCGLAASELEAEVAPPKDDQEKPGFLFESTFQALIGGDVIIYKLGGYIADLKAKLIDVNRDRVILQHRHTGLLPYWGSKPAQQPVEVELHFGNGRNTVLDAQGRLMVRVRIRPLGWIKNDALFQERAKKVFRDLREFFAAN